MSYQLRFPSAVLPGLRRVLSGIALTALGLAGLPASSVAAWPAASLQDPLVPPTTGGLEVIDRALAKLATHRRLLILAAHPDDEDTTLLTRVALGEGGEAAYLALNRGEGGQNLIGPELGVGLGLIRSQELLSARRVDGARQFFTRAYDFGYTRSLEETLERWPQKLLEEDALRVIRRFRPQVMVSVFPPTAAAGHGQHQAAGVIAERVFDLAGRPEAAPELLAEGALPWRPQALYRSGWFDREAEANRFPLGVVEPFSGRSYLQIALASRGLHRSQDMGRLLQLGAREGRLLPVAGVATAQGTDPFAGIDTRPAAILGGLEDAGLRASLTPDLDAVEELAREAREKLSPSHPEAAAESLGRILALLRQVRGELGEEHPGEIHAGALLDEKILIAQEGLAAAAGLVFDAATDRETLVPGETVELTVEVWNSSGEPVTVAAVELGLPEGWKAELQAEDGEEDQSVAAPRRLAAGELGSWTYRIAVAEQAPATLPYFLRQPLAGDVYSWQGVAPSVRGEPFQPPVLTARVSMTTGHGALELEREVVQRFSDQARGEVRRPLRVVPPVEVSVAPDSIVWPVGRSEARRLEVRLTNHRQRPVQGELTLDAPAGWPALDSRSFELSAGGQQSLSVDLQPPSLLPAGKHRIAVTAAVEGEVYGRAVPTVEYEHIRPVPYPRVAEVRIHAGDLQLPELGRVGYVRGASDRVPEALQRIGVPVELLTDEMLEVGDLSAFDVLVVGSRAYETNPTLGRVNGRLLEYVRGGGRLVVQYQQYQFVRGDLALLPLDIARPHDRVTDETAPVTVLDPTHPVFLTPNSITAEDWQGWVQERGLYFAHTWDSAFTPLLSLPGPAGEPLEGGLLIAPIGEGEYLYSGLAFFRQLPAGVVGAYRLFLNLLAPPARPPGPGATLPPAPG
ncbi:MAG: PIG-L family deacetylase [Acidobacteriota bacterium]|nr:PIG-L family deacetylase [Acidobacteriota bacterium]